MHPVLFKVGPFTVYTYGFFILMGVISGYLVSSREARIRGVNKEILSNTVFRAVVFGFLGAKALYILIEARSFFQDPLTMIRSGFVFYGGILAGITSIYYSSRKYEINFWKLMDIIVPGVPLAHALGRIGCFFYGCCYGRICDSWIGVKFPPGSPAGEMGAKVIPTQLISSFFLLIIFAVILSGRRRAKFNGELSCDYLILYGVFRFLIEFFRGDPRGYVLWFSTSQLISLVLVCCAVFFRFRLRKRP